MVGTRQGLPSWIGAAAASRVEIDGNAASVPGTTVREGNEVSSEQSHRSETLADFELNFAERALSAAGAAVLSAVLVNPLDVAKTRLQAQAAGVPYDGLCSIACFETNTMLPDVRCSPSCTRAVLGAEPARNQECSRYRGTMDVFSKVIRQETILITQNGMTSDKHGKTQLSSCKIKDQHTHIMDAMGQTFIYQNPMQAYEIFCFLGDTVDGERLMLSPQVLMRP